MKTNYKTVKEKSTNSPAMSFDMVQSGLIHNINGAAMSFNRLATLTL